MIKLSLYSFLAIYFTWSMYLMTMSLKTHRKKLKAEGKKIPWPSKIFGYPLAFFFLAVDWLLNYSVMILVFMDLPASYKELVTGRVNRYLRTKRFSWRGKLAYWFCVSFLDPFDPNGQHCKH